MAVKYSPNSLAVQPRPVWSVCPVFDQVVFFDVALIEEIGRRLQIPIEIQNYAFEGLSDALQINQIDLAIAAISIIHYSR